MRARIQITFEGNMNMEPIELHDQVLNNLEYRFYEHFEEDRTATIDSTNQPSTNVTRRNE